LSRCQPGSGQRQHIVLDNQPSLITAYGQASLMRHFLAMTSSAFGPLLRLSGFLGVPCWVTLTGGWHPSQHSV
jgi:hypothetical protein